MNAIYATHIKTFIGSRFCALLLVFCLVPTQLLAGTDVVILRNGDRITGEIKKLNNGNLVIDADYGGSDFSIEWEEIEQIQSSERFVIETSTGDRLIGTIASDPDSASKILVQEELGAVSIEKTQFVYLRPVETGFWGRFGASIDLGISLTKSDETRQFNTRSAASYEAENWSVDGNVNLLRNTREKADTTRRNEIGASYRRTLTGINDRLFATGFANFLQSNELQLDLRSTIGATVGSYLRRNNRWFLNVMGGAAWTSENYEEVPEDPTRGNTDKNSAEAVGAVELNIFDIGDLELFTVFSVFPSLSEFGRVRMDFDSNLRYEFINDFYISLGFTNNFDSSPPVDTSRNDYIFTTSIGWSY